VDERHRLLGPGAADLLDRDPVGVEERHDDREDPVGPDLLAAGPDSAPGLDGQPAVDHPARRVRPELGQLMEAVAVRRLAEHRHRSMQSERLGSIAPQLGVRPSLTARSYSGVIWLVIDR
jgi:hypothetical protein